MSRAIDTLMTEHRLILKVLGSLETFAGRVQQGTPGDREIVGQFAEFFRDFADRWHHGKEEDRLFEVMVAHGFPREEGPIAVMLAEHVEGREHVAALATVGSGTGPLAQAERDEVAGRAAAYVPLLRAHIQKEDTVLYPMAIRAVPPAVMDSLHSDFEAFERGVMGEAARDQLHRVADSLVASYPPEHTGEQGS